MIENSPYKADAIERGVYSLQGSQAKIIPTEPLNVPLGQRQLVMHRSVMEDYYDCRRTVHPVQKHPDNPLIRAEEPWEGIGATGNGTVIFDQELGKFRLYSQTWNYPESGQKEDRDFRGILYESDDGFHWERPNLGQVDFQGSRENNLLHFIPEFNVGVVSVFQLPGSHRHLGRFGAVIAGGYRRPSPSQIRKNIYQFLAFSDDGYIWKVPEDRNPLFSGRCDCQQPIVWNPERKVFMYYRRATVNAQEIRRIAYTESSDLVSWTQPRLIIGPDELDTIYLYGMPVSRYQNIYLGLLQNLYAHADYENISPPKSSQIDIHLAWSPDGFSWERHPERPVFIPTGPLRRGVADWGQIFAMSNIIDVGDRVHIYYCGLDGLHTSVAVEKGRYICLATLRRDGFVSLDTPREGWALTAPLRCPGGKLHINAGTAGDGLIQVAVREGQGIRDGEWPEEWSLDHATDFVGDSIDHEVNWKGQGDLSAWKDKTIRLEFRMIRSQLYSFWFA